MQKNDIACKTCWIQISDSENNSFDCSSNFSGKAKIKKMLFVFSFGKELSHKIRVLCSSVKDGLYLLRY